MKTNIEYLKDDIEKALFMPVAFKNQLMEWIGAIQEELDVKTETDNDEKDETIYELEQEIESLKEDWIDPDRLITIDFGYGEVKYINPDNVKLQCVMEDFKEKHSAHYSY